MTNDDISLRQYLERVIELRFASITREQELIAKNLSLQASEYERRLTELNHAHAQAVTDKAKFLNTDLFHSRMTEVDKQLVDLGLWRSRLVGIGVGAGIAGGAVVALIARLIQ